MTYRYFSALSEPVYVMSKDEDGWVIMYAANEDLGEFIRVPKSHVFEFDELRFKQLMDECLGFEGRNEN